ncbi:MAG: DUF6702 family protein [Saprospiraceae bacterium]
MMWVIFWFALGPVFWTEWPHALYLGVIELSMMPNQWQAEIKVFANDLEDAIRNEIGHRIPLQKGELPDEAIKPITEYFQDHFICGTGSHESPLIWQGIHREGDAVWIRFNLQAPTRPGTVQIRADFLMELFPTQINVLKIISNPDSPPAAMAKLTKSNPQFAYEFN